MDTYWDSAFVELCVDDVAAGTVEIHVDLLDDQYMHTSPNDIADEHKMTYPNVADSYNEWQCVDYTDTSGFGAESRCEYKLLISFMDDPAN
jgi:hypothetical protein